VLQDKIRAAKANLIQVENCKQMSASNADTLNSVGFEAYSTKTITHGNESSSNSNLIKSTLISEQVIAAAAVSGASAQQQEQQQQQIQRTFQQTARHQKQTCLSTVNTSSGANPDSGFDVDTSTSTATTTSKKYNKHSH
jgi:hypothetical protein